MAKKKTSPWKIDTATPKKTRQGVSRNSKSHKKYRGQGGRPKRRKK